jgi:hypothetical protein
MSLMKELTMAFRPPLPRPKKLSGSQPPGTPKTGLAPRVKLTAAHGRPGDPPASSMKCK